MAWCSAADKSGVRERTNRLCTSCKNTVKLAVHRIYMCGGTLLIAWGSEPLLICIWVLTL